MEGPVEGTATAETRIGLRARVVAGPKLPFLLAALATLLVSPSLFIGFHIDDLTHRHMLSSLPGAEMLREAYQSPFGIANGKAESVRTQIENGLAPWWTPDDLLISLWRPVSEATHQLDAHLWPDSAVAMHAHNLAWFFALVALAGFLYRSVWGPTTVAFVAAAFYAVDHTHGFAVGWIANRNVVIAATFAVASLLCYRRSLGAGLAMRAASLGLLLLALLSGEGSVAIVGYVAAHALFLEDAPAPVRILRVAPYFLLVALWQLTYRAIGRGAHGSGLYIEPLAEPWHFAAAVLERVPILVYGLFSVPPSEYYVFAEPEMRPVFVGGAWLFLAVVAWWLFPLVRGDRVARFWATGLLASLLPACSTHPHNRLLFFAGLGAFGLLAQAWNGHLEGASWVPRRPLARVPSRVFTALVAGFHLLLSPLILPVTASSVAYTAPVNRGLAKLVDGPSLRGKTVVFLHVTDFYQTKLLRTGLALAGKPLPERVYGLSYGSGPLEAERVGPRTLELRWPEGLWTRPLDVLYRDVSEGISAGYKRRFSGLTVRVLSATADGRPTRARFVFDRDLDAESFHWVRWDALSPRVFSFRDVKRVTITRSEAPLGW